jgi:hypothetical protein
MSRQKPKPAATPAKNQRAKPHRGHVKHAAAPRPSTAKHPKKPGPKQHEPYHGKIAPDTVVQHLRESHAYYQEHRQGFLDDPDLRFGDKQAADLLAAATELEAASAATGGDLRLLPPTAPGAGAAIARLHRYVKIARDQIATYARDELDEKDGDTLKKLYGFRTVLRLGSFEGVLVPAQKLLAGSRRDKAKLGREADVTPRMIALIEAGVAAVEGFEQGKAQAQKERTGLRTRFDRAWERGERLLSSFRRKNNGAFFDEEKEEERVAGLECYPRETRHAKKKPAAPPAAPATPAALPHA